MPNLTKDKIRFIIDLTKKINKKRLLTLHSVGSTIQVTGDTTHTKKQYHQLTQSLPNI